MRIFYLDIYCDLFQNQVMKYKKLCNFAEIKSGYAFRGAVVDDANGDLPVVLPRNIVSKNFADCVNVKSAALATARRIPKNSVLVTNRGTFAACVFDGGFEAITTSGVFVVTLRSDVVVTPEFLALYINSEIGQRQILSKQETMTVPALTVRQLSELEIPLIPKNKQVLLSGLYGVYCRRLALIAELQKTNTSFINQILKGAING